MEKFGFIYVWYDKKHKRYYLGSHWGFEEDGYICSSDNMRKNYKNRPHDFKRRTVKRVYTDRANLLKEEQRWLDMIKTYEFGRKYYNISRTANGIDWNANTETVRQTREIMQEKSWSKPRTDAQLKASTDNVAEGRKNNPAVKPGWIPKHRFGTKHTEETKKQMALKRKEFYTNPENAKKIGDAISKGKKAMNLGFRAQFFLDYLKDKEWMTSQQISKDTNLGWDTVYRYLRDLSRENKVQKQLKGRDAYWKIA